ncbi:MAG: hypothetical protein SH856_02565 [Flavobacteriales bacterium]|nr:hypothetical protein [Flavobacteriales bacterium]
MRRKILIVLALALGQLAARSQLIVAGEYFWDTDPGAGLATPFDVADLASIDATVSFSPAGLNEGNHILGVRTKNSIGQWSDTDTKTIYVHQFTGAEYFWNTDPGAGNGTPAALSTTLAEFNGNITISTVGVAPGNRYLGVRTKGKGDVWSVPKVQKVYVPTVYSEGEYFWDADPGVGNGTSFSLAPQIDNLDQEVAVNSGESSPGVHYLFSRVRGINGSFGTTYKKRFYISRNIVGGEYFWDTDPGAGNGTPLGVIAVGDSVQVCGAVTTNGFAPGIYWFYVRTVSEDGQWSHPKGVEVTVTESTVTVGCTGDFDLNGNINTSDLLLFLGSFGQIGICSFDITGDYTVNTSDLLLFLGAFGTTCD